MILKEILDFTGYYASDDGRIFSALQKGCRDRNDLSKRVPLRELKYRYTSHGYARVCMRRDSTGKREDVYVHRIIALMFLKNPNCLLEVNHIDCNRSNNSVTNLEWISRIDNLKYAEKYGHLGRNEKGQFSYR